MNRLTRTLLSSIVAASAMLAPTAAGAADENVVLAVNQTDGLAVVEASVQYRKAANGVIDEQNRARAEARCTGCQTLAAAFQLVLVTKDWHTLAPQNEAFVGNLECVECVTWASAKQVLVATGGPAELSEAGHARLRALEDRLEGLEDVMAVLSLEDLVAEVEAAFGELIAIGREEVVRSDGGPNDTEVVAARSA